MKKYAGKSTAEAAFALSVFAVSAFFVIQAFKLYRAHPGADGPAAVPLVSAALAAAASLFTAVKSLCAGRVDSDGSQSRLSLFPAGVTAGMCVVYCALMTAGLSFWLVTPLFLWGFMTLLQRGGYLKNILWTALFMAFVFAVFRLLFGLSFG